MYYNDRMSFFFMESAAKYLIWIRIMDRKFILVVDDEDLGASILILSQWIWELANI